MRVLIVDDEPIGREVLARALDSLGIAFDAAEDGAEAWTRFDAAPYDVVISDWRMPEVDGLELCRRIRSRAGDRYPYFILLTASGSADDVRPAIELGVDDFLNKPLDVATLDVRLRVAERISRLRHEHDAARARIATLEAQTTTPGAELGLIGDGDAIRQVARRLSLAAKNDIDVLVVGESGTGKELAARALHALSGRAARPFLAINCAAIPETLLESELFGHVKGAFTGADRDKVGLFEAASGGTLFLDEIGDVPPMVQVKLLRVLQEREVTRVGESTPRAIDVRLVTATNRDMAKLVVDDKIRRDFFFRIRVFEVRMPPLRERRSDIPELVDHFRCACNERHDMAIESVDDDAIRAMMNYPWPGNVRELQNAIQHAFIVADGTTITADHLPPEVLDPSLYPGGLLPAPTWTPEQEAERDEIVAALEATDWNRTAAATRLGVSRVTLWKKMRRFAIERA